MLSVYTKQLLVASAIGDKIKKLEKCIDNSMHLPARQGVIDKQREYVNELKEQIEFLKGEQYMWGASK